MSSESSAQRRSFSSSDVFSLSESSSFSSSGSEVLAGSLLAVIYIWRVVEVAYFRQAPDEALDVDEAPISMLMPIWVLAGAAIFFGVFTSLSVGLASAAARMLFGVEL